MMYAITLLLEGTVLSSQNAITALLVAGVSSATGIVTALLTYFLTKRKSDADIHKTESETVTNLYKIIHELQGQIEVWFGKVKETRTEASKVEEQNSELRATIREMAEDKQSSLKALETGFRKEKDNLYDHIARALTVAKKIEKEALRYPEYNDLHRDTIQIVEMLTFIKSKLDTSIKRPKTLNH